MPSQGLQPWKSLPVPQSPRSRSADAEPPVMNQLPEVRYDDAGTERVVFTLPPTDAPERDSVLVFALPKAGSVLLNRIMQDLSRKVGLRYVSIMAEYFTLGIPDELHPATTSEIFLRRGYCYGGFRYVPTFAIPIIPAVRKVLLVRDPRDMLVSYYYSMLKSHPSPGNVLDPPVEGRDLAQRLGEERDLAQRLGVDAYARQMAPVYREYFGGYRRLCTGYEIDFFPNPSTYRNLLSRLFASRRKSIEQKIRVYRYEDVIYAKETWIQDICDWFSLPIDKQSQVAVAKGANIFPAKEREDKHIRQVHPGNYQSKLSQETINFLTDYFYDDMKFFGYAIER
jgi:hypothetical protein